MPTLAFTKMVGAGNDFIVVDASRNGARRLTRRWPTVSRALCDRQRGIGADGVLLLEPSRIADVRMRIFNADGSEADMCGNGARCVARYVGRRRVSIESGAGRLQAAVSGERVRLGMTDPAMLRQGLRVRVAGRLITGDFINTGVPHFVVRVPALDRVDVARLGRALRRHAAFAPKGANVNFIQPAGRHALRIRTYERGVEAETLACGTGATAAAIIYGLPGRPGPRRVSVTTRSGDTLTISFRVGSRVTHVVLEGPARRVFDGRVSV